MRRKIKQKLFSAVEKGNLEEVKLITSDLPLKSLKIWALGFDLICNALKSKNTKIAKLLISLGLPVVDEFRGEEIFELAVLHGDVETVQMLLQRKPYILPLSKTELSPFFSITERLPFDDVASQVFDYLLHNLLNINDKFEGNGYTLLHFAAECGNINTLPLILGREANLNETSKNGDTALHVAAKKNHSQFVSLLLDHGANYELKNQFSNTPLYYAIQERNVSTIDIILDRAISEKRFENIIPLPTNNIDCFVLFYYAAATGKKEIVEMLLLKGINFNEHFERTGMTPLHVAIKNGKADIVELLLKQGADWTATQKGLEFSFKTSTFPDGYTVIHMAAEKGHKEIINMLLDYGSFNSISTPAGKRGYTPLHVAVESGHEDIVKLFLEKGVPVNCPTSRGLVSLHVAAQKGHESIVKLLLEYGTPVDVVGRTTFECSTEVHSTLETYETYELLETDGVIDLTRKGRLWIIKWEEAFTPLYAASYYGHTRIVRTLLEKGADPNVSFEKGLTPLHGAAQEGHIEIVDLLLKNGALANLNKFSTPLIVAAKGGHEEIVKLLLLHDADVKAKLCMPYFMFSKCIEYVFSYKDLSDFPFCCEWGFHRTALHFAVQAGKKTVVDMLLKYGANVNESSRIESPLKLAVFKNDVEIVRQLLEGGADINCEKFPSETLLCAAVREGNLDMVEILLKKGLPVHTNSDEIDFPLHCAITNGHERIINKLIEYGAELNSVCSEGLTPLYHSVEAGNLEILKMLLRQGESFKTKTSRGESLLHYALKSRVNEKMFKLLLRCGADLNARNQEGKSVFHFAVQVGNKGAVDLLLQHDVNVNALDRSGNTACMSARNIISQIAKRSYKCHRLDAHWNDYIPRERRAGSYYTSYWKEPQNSSICNRPYEDYFDKNDDDIYVRDPRLYFEMIFSIAKEIARREIAKEDNIKQNLDLMKESMISNYYDSYKREIKKMTLTKITEDVSYFDILVGDENKLTTYAANKMITNNMKFKEYHKLFPEYANVLKSRMERGKKRLRLLDKNEEPFRKALKWEAPILVLDQIFSHLRRIDLRNLYRACKPVNLDDSDSDEDSDHGTDSEDSDHGTDSEDSDNDNRTYDSF